MIVPRSKSTLFIAEDAKVRTAVLFQSAVAFAENNKDKKVIYVREEKFHEIPTNVEWNPRIANLKFIYLKSSFELTVFLTSIDLNESAHLIVVEDTFCRFEAEGQLEAFEAILKELDLKLILASNHGFNEERFDEVWKVTQQNRLTRFKEGKEEESLSILFSSQ